VEPLYPLELSLHFIKTPWGGWPGQIGEIRSLSGSPYESMILNGRLSGQHLTQIVGAYQQQLLGKDIELDPREPFPLLLKFIYTTRDLPIQVHPDDAYTLEKGLPMVGRDKLYYVLMAKPGSRMYLGFKEKLSKEEIRTAIEKHTLSRYLNAVELKPDRCYTIPPGRIHGVGGHMCLLEIQRHSELNFVLFDKEAAGEKEEISSHLDSALEVLDYEPIVPHGIEKVSQSINGNQIEYLALTPHFSVRNLVINSSLELSLSGKRFVVYTCVKGKASIGWGSSNLCLSIQSCQSVLVPAISGKITFTSEAGCQFIETTIPNLTADMFGELIKSGIKRDRIEILGGDDYRDILKNCLK
jgi:mannose-6-phosphate isomerase